MLLQVDMIVPVMKLMTVLLHTSVEVGQSIDDSTFYMLTFNLLLLLFYYNINLCN